VIETGFIERHEAIGRRLSAGPRHGGADQLVCVSSYLSRRRASGAWDRIDYDRTSWYQC
jgi:hypothetical protein